MRPIAVVVFAVVVLGTLFAYLRIVEQEVAPPEFKETTASGTFSLKLTLPFDAKSSEFSDDGASLLIRLDGREIVRKSEDVKAGIRTFDNIEGVKVGRNEFLVKVIPAEPAFQPSDEFSFEEPADEDDQQEPIPVAIRLQVFRDGVLLGESTQWNSPGLTLVASFMIEVEAIEVEGGDE